MITFIEATWLYVCISIILMMFRILNTELFADDMMYVGEKTENTKYPIAFGIIWMVLTVFIPGLNIYYAIRAFYYHRKNRKIYWPLVYKWCIVLAFFGALIAYLSW